MRKPQKQEQKKIPVVSRSIYQKVCEENKRLWQHLEIITGDLSPARIFLSGKYREKFEADKKFNKQMKEIILQCSRESVYKPKEKTTKKPK